MKAAPSEANYDNTQKIDSSNPGPKFDFTRRIKVNAGLDALKVDGNIFLLGKLLSKIKVAPNFAGALELL